MKRIILHWTAGGHKASATDRQHYHRLIEGDGRVIDGVHPISANSGPLRSGHYAAHTASLNTGSIGVSVCAMAGAQYAPFDRGRAPITEAQLQSLVAEVARLARQYGIPITPQTVLTHAEVQPTLGVAQAGKWDITWLPGWTTRDTPRRVGDHLRALIAAQAVGSARPPSKPVPNTATPTQSPLAVLIAWLKRIFGG